MPVFFFAGLILWLLVLSWLLYQTRKHYFDLISKTNKRRLDEILETLIIKDGKIESELLGVKQEIKKMFESSQTYIQKIGLIRFNPFKTWDTDQSFVLAILNGNNDGLVLNYIYTKEGLRVYTKKIKNGKGEEYELSEEEKKAIEKSKKSV